MIRSVAYPAIPLQTAVEAISKVDKALNRGPYSRDSLLEALNYGAKSGRGHRVVAAMVHYGLLSRKGNTYHQGELASKVLRPISADERNYSLEVSALKPKLFSAIHSRYTGSTAPSMLDNILIREYSVSPGAAKEVTSIFMSTMEFVGLLKNGVLANSEEADVNKQGEEDIELDADIAEEMAPRQNRNQTSQTDSENITISLPSEIVLIVPQKYSYKFAMGDFKRSIEELEKATSDHPS